MNKNFLGKISKEVFIKQYWNKKPLLIKQAVPEVAHYANFKDFYDLASDEEFETRMVYEKGGDYPWQAIQGPFRKKDYKKNALWTLICHNLELLNTDFYNLKQNVNFIPEWNFDDIMATISKKGASVGAHIDDYSVFIIQAAGKRKWLLDQKAQPDYIPNLDIRLLKNFNPTIEWVLEPGDMLYLPPNLAHHGVSLEDSISYSVGFKSIRYKDFLSHYLCALDHLLEDKSFHDKKLILQNDKFQIKEYVLDQVYKEVFDLVSNKDKFNNSLLSYLSRSKNDLKFDNRNPKSIQTDLKAKAILKRNIWAKFVSHKLINDQYKISINLKVYEVDKYCYQKLHGLFSQEADSEFSFSKSDLKNTTYMNLWIDLIRDGVFYFA
jgi:50S ribosomal protein L16 3-hydroxylase